MPKVELLPATPVDSDRFLQYVDENFRRIADTIASLKATDIGGGIPPINSVVLWWGTAATVPTGWAICDGTNGTPDLRGRVPVGVDTGQTEFATLGQTGGSKTIVTADLAVHGHGLNNHAHGSTSSVESATHVHGTGGINTTHTHHPQAKVRTNNTAHAHDNDSAEYSTSPSGSGTSFGTANVITDGDSVDHNHGNTGGQNVNHLHTISGDNGVTADTGSGTVGGKLSPYLALHFIMRVS